MDLLSIQTELEELLRLTAIEREEEIRLYEQNVANRSLSEKRDTGVAWHPVTVLDQGFGLGGDAYLVVERTRDREKAHQFREGQVVSVGTWEKGTRIEVEKGVIDYVNAHRMKVILYRKDLPDWVDSRHLAVEWLADERSYRDMENAIKAVIKAGSHTRLYALRNILLGFQPASMDVEIDFHPGNLLGLNEAQTEAVRRVAVAKDIAVIHGPPGTGKTTTLVHAIRYLTEQRRSLRILVCAPSNAATDLLTMRIAASGIHVTRIGNLSRIDDELLRHTLQSQLSSHPESKHIRRVRLEANQTLREARRYRRSFGEEDRQERKRQAQTARDLHAWAKDLEDKLVDQLIENAQVITTTLTGAAVHYLSDRLFDYVIIDEAAQALEGATWIPIRLARRVVLAGDPLQLPPTVKSAEATRKGLGITLLEKYMQRQSQTQLLHIQYRMHEAIMGFSNQYFYHGLLQAAAGVAAEKLESGDTSPLTFIDTTGCGFQEEQKENQLSRYNSGEYFILREHLYQLVYAYAPAQPPPVAIISPYKVQVEYITDAISKDPLLNTLTHLRANTIDGFQGQENDIVYISLVRSNEKNEIGFLSDYRRMNVALTRARRKLVVIGDSGTLCNDPFYAAFIAYCEANNAYRSAWEWMYQG